MIRWILKTIQTKQFKNFIFKGKGKILIKRIQFLGIAFLVYHTILSSVTSFIRGPRGYPLWRFDVKIRHTLLSIVMSHQ